MIPSLGGTNLDIYTHFPLSLIERIEVIRGPGSVLYGTNAFAGVLNIVTKSVPDENTVEVSATYGSYDTKKAEALALYSKNGFNLSTAISRMKSDGWKNETKDLTGASGSYDTQNSNHQITLNANYKNLTLNSIIGKSKANGLSPLIRFPVGKHKMWRNFVDLGYKRQLPQDWTLDLNATYNGFNIAIGNIDQETLESRGILFEASAKKQFGENFNFITGITYDHLDGSLGPSQSDYNTWRGSLYTQGGYQATDWLKLVAGLQINQPKGINKDLSPRLAAIFTMNKDWGAKLLYGESFRTAFGAISFNNNVVFKGNPDLDPEKMRTYEAQLLYHPDNFDFGLTLYKSYMSDIQVREVVGGFTTTLNSDNEYTFNGIEFEGKASLDDQWSIQGSVSYQTSEDENDVRDVTFSPNLMAKLGVSYDSGRGYQAGLFNSYFSEAGKSENTRSGVAVVNPKADAYNMMTANLDFDLEELFDSPNMYGMKLNVFVDNLLDENVHYPDTNRFTVNTVPQHSGRTVFARLSVTF